MKQNVVVKKRTIKQHSSLRKVFRPSLIVMIGIISVLTFSSKQDQEILALDHVVYSDLNIVSNEDKVATRVVESPVETNTQGSNLPAIEDVSDNENMYDNSNEEPITNDVAEIEVVEEMPEGYKSAHAEYIPVYMPAIKLEEAIITDNTPVNKSFTEDTSINSYSGLTADEINTILEGTPMSGLGEVIYSTEREWKVNARFILSVATQESGKGKSSVAQNKNNLFGIMTGAGEPRYFDSFKECIKDFGRMISEVYLNKGLDSVSEIAPIYCPPVPEDPENLNNLWKPNIISLLNSF